MQRSDVPDLERCPECAGRIRENNAERLCEQCGLICTEDRIDPGPEWRSFDDTNESQRRTGAPLTRSRHDRGLSTEIGYGSSSRLTGRKRRQMHRLRREHNRARIPTKADRNRVYGFTEIRSLIGHLSLPRSVQEQACSLYTSAQKANLFQGRSLEGFAAASIYAVCRILSIPRTVEEIVHEAKATTNELKAAYDALNRELGLPVGPIDPTQYLPRFASKLDLDTSIERHAKQSVQRLLENRLIGGRNPCGVAAGCLYAAAQHLETSVSITQADAANVADVTPATVRSTVDLLGECPMN
ncbi:transcription initiation factor IIB family protein [Halobacteria archaeon AArc-curdl1]|uniref:Transcription initiation factor IIB n=1 Tax=Natronosalvus hydrolyticus TaxID=2979988 RepID=A0AAP2ZBI9_9EURY|nr:transcription initiation factor IIB family protein [Halobacteria archaeon AArc-curdl1]